MDAVLEDATIHRRRQTLLRMTNGVGLDEAYSATLSRIQGQKGNKVKLGMEVLMWLLRSERPLKAEELCHALGVEVGTADLNVDNVPSVGTLLCCTLGLVTVDEHASTVRLVHFTLQEYLSAHSQLFITSHSMMAKICLTYLNFQSICELSAALDTIPSATPFLHYASCSWAFHARKEMTGAVKTLAIRLLERDASHISAGILLREDAVGLLSWWDRYAGRHLDLQGFTGLHCIALMGITEIAISMVDMKRWGLNGRDSKGATPLIWAIKYGNWALAKILLKQEDIDPIIRDKKGLAPLTHAVKAGHEGVVKQLLERRDVKPGWVDMDCRTPLSYAAEWGVEGVVKILLERKDVDPDSWDHRYRTPLSYAAKSGHEGVVKILLERGDVNPDLSGKSGETPLSYAVKSGHEGVVEMLLARGDANPDSLDKAGQTPPSLAASSGSNSVGVLLSEPRPSSHDTSQSTDVTQQISAPMPSTQEEVELAPMSQQHPTIPDTAQAITEVVPFYPSRPSLYQLEAPPSASLLPPMSTSDPAPAPDPTSPKHPGCLKRCLTAIGQLFCYPKRRHRPSSFIMPLLPISDQPEHYHIITSEDAPAPSACPCPPRPSTKD